MLIPLRDALHDWRDFDGAEYHLARCLGIIDTTTDFQDVKHLFWTDNSVGNLLYSILENLTRAGMVETNDDQQFRWKGA